MSDVMSEYRSKVISATDAAAMVRSNDIVDYFAFTGASRYLDAALAQRVGELENVTIRSELRLAPPFEVFMADPEGRSFVLDSLFYGPLELMVPRTQRTWTPAPLSFFEALFRRGDLHCDVASVMVSPPDNEGYLHFSPSPSLAKTLAQYSRVFCAEINETYFPLRGTEDRRIHLSEVKYLIEGDSPPMFGLPIPPISDEDQKIAAHVLGVVRDGSCLQIGYGAVPEAVATLIAGTEVRELGIHTEFLSDGIMRLWKAGKVTGAKKATDPGKIVAGIAFGSSELYDFVRDCPDLYMVSSTYANNPGFIRQNDHFVSVNAFLEIDLTGQVNAESISTNVRSGTRRHPVQRLDLHQTGRNACIAHPADPARGRRSHHTALLRALRLHRVRHGQPPRPQSLGAVRTADQHRAPQFSGRVDPAGTSHGCLAQPEPRPGVEAASSPS
jgi:acyl-CoA hydrolase